MQSAATLRRRRGKVRMVSHCKFMRADETECGSVTEYHYDTYCCSMDCAAKGCPAFKRLDGKITHLPSYWFAVEEGIVKE